MQRCPTCDTANRLGSRYCNACGAPFEPPALCAGCGAAMPAVFRHCGYCGAALSAMAEPVPPAEPTADAESNGLAAVDVGEELPDLEADVPGWEEPPVAALLSGIPDATLEVEEAPFVPPSPERVLPDWLFLRDLPDWLFEPEPERTLPDWLFLEDEAPTTV